MPNELNLQITTDDQSAQGYSSAQSKADAYLAAVERMAAQLVVAFDKVEKKLGDVGKQTDEARKHLERLHEPLSDLAEGVNAFGNRLDEAFSLKGLGAHLGEELAGVIGLVAVAQKGIEMFSEAVHEATDFAGEGITKADTIRDLDLSLGVLTGSAANASQALDFFKKKEAETRNTTEELGASLRDLSPLMQSKGFDATAQDQIDLMLSQLATISNRSQGEIQSGFRQVLAGRISPGRNPLLQVLGITKDDVADLNWDQLLGKMQEISERFPEFGQTIESTLHKSKETLLVDFAEGFDGARGSAESGMGAIKEIVSDPAITEAMHGWGEETAHAVGEIADALRDPAVRSSLADLVTLLGTATKDTASLVAHLTLAVGLAHDAWSAQQNQPTSGGWKSLFGLDAGSTEERWRSDLASDQANLAYQRKGLAIGSYTPEERRQHEDEIARLESAVANDERALASLASSTGSAGGYLGSARYLRQAAGGAELEGFNGPSGERAAGERLYDLQAKDAERYLLVLQKLNEYGKDGTLTYLDFANAFAEVAKEEEKLTGLGQHPHGLVKPDPNADKRDAKQELADQIAILKDKLTLDEMYVASQQKVSAASKAASPFDAQQAAEDLGLRKQLLTLSEQESENLLKLRFAEEYGTATDEERYRKQIENIGMRRAALVGEHDQLKALYSANFWDKFAEENAQAMYKATSQVADFAEKSERELTAMSPEIAAKVRSDLAAIDEKVAASIALIQAMQGASDLLFGIPVDSPAMKRRVGNLEAQVGRSASIGEINSLAGGREHQKILETASRNALDLWRNDLGGIFTSAAEGGGKSFFASVDSDFKKLTAEGGKILAADLMALFGGGTPGNPNKTDITGNLQDPSKFYDASGRVVTTQTAQRVGAGLQIAEIGLGAYDTTRQGGSRTDAGISSAIAGAAIGTEINPGVGTIVGAIVGLVVGEIGAALGAAEAKSNWKFFTPAISRDGQVSIAGAQNLSDAAQLQAVAQIQSKFNQTNDALVNLVVKLGGKPIDFLSQLIQNGQPIPGVQGGVPGQGQILPGITSRPTAGFMQDVQAWLTETLPRALEDFYSGQVATGFEKLGLAADRFKLIFAALDKVDPSKTIQELTTLAAALVEINRNIALFSTVDPMGIAAGSHLYEVLTGQMGLERGQTYGQQLAGKPESATGAATGDAAIIDFANQIHFKSVEGQIADEQTLAGMLSQRYKVEEAAIRAIFDLANQAKSQFESDLKNIDLQEITKSDGSPDYYGQADYLKKAADADLTQLHTSHNTTEANAAFQAYRQDVLAATQALLQQATTPDEKKAALEWERTNLGIGQTELQGDLTRFGQDLNTQNDILEKELVPALHDLTGAIVGATKPGSPTTPGTPGAPYQPKNSDFTVIAPPIVAAVTSGNSLLVEIRNLLQDIQNQGQHVTVNIPSPDPYGLAGFGARTAAERAA
jgi:hypothetical protein